MVPGVAAHPHEQDRLFRPQLLDRQIELQPLGLGQTRLMDVLGDADHRATRRGSAVKHDALADRILSRPHGVRHPLAHHRDERSIRAIGVGDPAAPENPRSHRLEVMGGRHLDREPTESPDGVHARYEEPGALRAPERHADPARRGRDLRHRLRFLGETACEIRGLACREPSAARVRMDVEHGVDVIAEAERAHVMQAPDEQAGPNEQHDGERALQDEQH